MTAFVHVVHHCLYFVGINQGSCFRINHFPDDNDYDTDSSEYLLRKWPALALSSLFFFFEDSAGSQSLFNTRLFSANEYDNFPLVPLSCDADTLGAHWDKTMRSV